eukprot:4393574-Ditylum_brightwellii.AAC.1
MELWTFAFQYVVDQWNKTPKRNLEYKTLNEVFSDLRTRQSRKSATVNNFHPFGCPVYVLEKPLVDGGHAPKWYPHSILGIYLGYSRDHARNVAWVLNPNTDHMSSQYHVICDNMFTTVAATSGTDKIELWKGLHKTFPCPDIEGLFNQDTFNIRPSKDSPIKLNTDKHPIQTT